jgi:hypothetical protein
MPTITSIMVLTCMVAVGWAGLGEVNAIGARLRCFFVRETARVRASWSSRSIVFEPNRNSARANQPRSCTICTAVHKTWPACVTTNATDRNPCRASVTVTHGRPRLHRTYIVDLAVGEAPSTIHLFAIPIEVASHYGKRFYISFSLFIETGLWSPAYES